jgi:hypothetical protein
VTLIGSPALSILLANSRRPPMGRSLGEMGYPGKKNPGAADHPGEFAGSITLDDPASRSCAAILVFPRDSRSFGNEGWPISSRVRDNPLIGENDSRVKSSGVTGFSRTFDQLANSPRDGKRIHCNILHCTLAILRFHLVECQPAGCTHPHAEARDGQAVDTTQPSVGCLPRDVASLRVRSSD